ncbi:hypothetical protein DFJ73DRAFT_798246 [Zopfochytrium polystomum]|nr:hypothetical protein DFJ73DRAFT_798246 [Zopfochytrium polystomum]
MRQLSYPASALFPRLLALLVSLAIAAFFLSTPQSVGAACVPLPSSSASPSESRPQPQLSQSDPLPSATTSPIPQSLPSTSLPSSPSPALTEQAAAAPADAFPTTNTSDTPTPSETPSVPPPATPPSGDCSSPKIRITEVDVGTTVSTTEDEVLLTPIIITPRSTAAGSTDGSLLAFMSATTGNVHVLRLAADDTVDAAFPAAVQVPFRDFGDAHTDDNGGFVVLGTRNAAWAQGTLNCGNPANLCGAPPTPPIPCYDMILAHLDSSGKETWAAPLTDTGVPPYSTSATGPNVVFIWWYAHHGRLAFDGAHFAAYFGAAISASEGGCINIHQGDRLRVVAAADGAPVSGLGDFDWGCSHSGYERLTFDDRTGQFAAICKTDNNNRVMFPDSYNTVYPVDLWYADLGDIVTDGRPAASDAGAGYWAAVSAKRPGQPAEADGLADVHLIHFSRGRAAQSPNVDLTLAADPAANDRAPHLALFGKDRSLMLAVWENATAPGELAYAAPGRAVQLQILDRASGAAKGGPVALDPAVVGNRYQPFKDFPDGSVAYASPGSAPTKIKVVRVMPC